MSLKSRLGELTNAVGRITQATADMDHTTGQLTTLIPQLDSSLGYIINPWPGDTRPAGHVSGSSDPDSRVAGTVVSTLTSAQERASTATADIDAHLVAALDKAKVARAAAVAANDDLERALGVVTRNLPKLHDPDIHGPQEVPQAPPGCRSHARIPRDDGKPTWAEVSRAGLCDWCYRWRLSEGQDPPIELVKTLDRKGHLTTKDVEEARTAQRKTKKRKKAS